MTTTSITMRVTMAIHRCFPTFSYDVVRLAREKEREKEGEIRLNVIARLTMLSREFRYASV